MSVTDVGRRSPAVRTFLIADIRGYTPFAAREGDEAASELALRFAAICAEAIEAWDGELVELRGDEALAAFDSPRHALRCAVELQDAFYHETNVDPSLPLKVGIGLDAGEAVPLADGYRGTALNVAARLSALAQAGQTLASADVTRLAGPVPGLRFGLAEPRRLKGIDRTLEAVLVGGIEHAEPDGVTWDTQVVGDDSFLPPELDPVVALAGRSPELRWLRWHWRRSTHGHGRTVVVSGPPSIGKTRLAGELATHVHAGGGRVQYLVGGADLRPADLAQHSSGSTLSVLDDLDALPTRLAGAVGELATGAGADGRMLLITHRQEVAPAIKTLVERIVPIERRLLLGPLAADAVREIAAVYAGRSINELPLDELVHESRGVPGAIHRLAAQRAQNATARPSFDNPTPAAQVASSSA